MISKAVFIHRWFYYRFFLCIATLFSVEAKNFLQPQHLPLDPFLLTLQHAHAAAEKQLVAVDRSVHISLIKDFYHQLYGYHRLKFYKDPSVLQVLAKNQIHGYYQVLSCRKLAQYFFTQEKFFDSIQYHTTADAFFSTKKNDKQHYQLAYAWLHEKKYSKALIHFQQLTTHASIYQALAHYYSGCILMKQKKYDQALLHFQIIQSHPYYQQAVILLMAQVYYQQKQFRALKKFLYTHQSLLTAQEILLQKMLAEAHFFLKEYADAVDIYHQLLKKSIQDPAIIYRLAYSLQQLGKWKAAATYYQHLIANDTLYSQRASEALGGIYLKMNEKLLALDAFESAYYANQEAQRTAVALWQCGMLAFHLKKFQQAIFWLEKWKKDYPVHEKMLEAAYVLSQAYLHTQGEAFAVQYIEQIKNPSVAIKALYQQITLVYGQQLFIQAQYPAAILMLKKSLSYPMVDDLYTQALFWLGESCAAAQFYEEAKGYYQLLIEEKNTPKELLPSIAYALGYIYFQTDHYAQALSYFLSTHQKIYDSIQKKDVILRIADCYFMQKDYVQALSYYALSIKNQYQLPHAYYYQGLIHSIKKNTALATAAWQKVMSHFTDTPYYAKTLWQSAHYCLAQSMYTKAIQWLGIYIEKNPDHKKIPQALLLKAIAYSNLNNTAAVKEACEKILLYYPKSVVAEDALLELQKITLLSQNITQWQYYLQLYQKVHPDGQCIAKVKFKAIKKMFYYQYYLQCITFSEQFLAEHSEGIFHEQILFFLGEAHYRLKIYDKALSYYQILIQRKDTRSYIKTMQRIAYIHCQQKNYEKALQTYTKLHPLLTKVYEQQINALHIIKMHELLTAYDVVIVKGLALLSAGQLSKNSQHVLFLILGRTFLKEKKYVEAKKKLKKIPLHARKSCVAEAQYLLAQMAYVEKKYEASLQRLLSMREVFFQQKDWLAKAYLLMADNYIAQKNDTQAKATLQSLLTHPQTPPVILTQAKERLHALSVSHTS